MDEEEHERQVMMINEDIDPDDEYISQTAVEDCMFQCGQTPDVAWQLGYDRPGRRMAVTGWIYICDCCDGESRKLAPYWWNKALRGESLDDEEE